MALTMTKSDVHPVGQGQPKKKTENRRALVSRSNPAPGLSRLDFSAGHGELLQQLIDEMNPVGLIEMHWVKTIAWEMIRMPRAQKMEADFINESSYEPEPPPSFEGIVATRLRPQRDVIETLVRYYQRYEATYFSNLIKALHELERLQRRRKGEAVPAPAALDLTVKIDAKDNDKVSLPPTIEQTFLDTDVVTI
jgi:hypothetical protein